MKDLFVMVAVGDRHVRLLDFTLAYLKYFSRSDIVVVQDRSQARPDHDQVIDAHAPEYLDDRQASIFLKTSLPRLLAGNRARCCYLDSDVIAVSGRADSIFDFQPAPVLFARDHVPIDVFSRYAVKCRCRETGCSHLRESMLAEFGVDVRQCDWQLWNGGVVLFNQESAGFFELWHEFTMRAFAAGFWQSRDQGTLATAAWKLGLQDRPTLPREYNFIVDRLWGVSHENRPRAMVKDFHMNTEYSLQGEAGKCRPTFLHFVNGGVGRTGWRNWDEVAAMVSAGAMRAYGD